MGERDGRERREGKKQKGKEGERDRETRSTYPCSPRGLGRENRPPGLSGVQSHSPMPLLGLSEERELYQRKSGIQVQEASGSPEEPG